MSSESSSLIGEPDATFRSVERTSNFRANIFAFQSVVVLGLYLFLIYGWKFTYFSAQAHLLATFGVIYMIRLNVMARWLLKRELAIEEITVVILVWLPAIMGSYVALAKE